MYAQLKGFNYFDCNDNFEDRNNNNNTSQSSEHMQREELLLFMDDGGGLRHRSIRAD